MLALPDDVMHGIVRAGSVQSAVSLHVATGGHCVAATRVIEAARRDWLAAQLVKRESWREVVGDDATCTDSCVQCGAVRAHYTGLDPFHEYRGYVTIAPGGYCWRHRPSHWPTQPRHWQQATSTTVARPANDG